MLQPKVAARRPAGGTVTIKVSAYKKSPGAVDQSLITVDAASITIHDTFGAVLVSGAALVYDSVGTYYYFWETEGLARGNYLISITAASESNDATQKLVVQLY